VVYDSYPPLEANPETRVDLVEAAADEDLA
jgi:hypothetical protein